MYVCMYVCIFYLSIYRSLYPLVYPALASVPTLHTPHHTLLSSHLLEEVPGSLVQSSVQSGININRILHLLSIHRGVHRWGLGCSFGLCLWRRFCTWPKNIEQSSSRPNVGREATGSMGVPLVITAPRHYWSSPAFLPVNAMKTK